MNKVTTTGYQLKKILGLYLKGIADKNANIHKIQQLIYTVNLQKLHAISIYQLVSHDPNNKLQSVIRLLDKKLMEYREYPSNSIKQSKGDIFSLVLNVYRLKTLVKYNLPYEETVQILLENILINNLKEADFDALFSLLQVQPASYSKSYNKLIANILDLLQQYLSTNQASPSFINTVVKYIYKSPYKISKALDSLINQSIDKSLHSFDMIQVLTLSNFMREKSLNQWIHLGMLDFSIIRKRIIFQYIMNKQFNGLQYRKYLPGKLWADSNELEQAIKCIRSIGSKQAFIEIFPVQQSQYTHPLEGYAPLQKMQFADHYIQNLFHFVKNSCRKFDHYSFDRIIRTLRSFFTDSIQNPLSLQYFSNFVQRYSINVLTLAIVVYELSRYRILQKEKLHEITSDYLRIIHSLITSDYLKNVTYEAYKYQELTLLYNYIYCQTVDHLVKVLDKSANEESMAKFKKIQVFLSSQRDRKYTVNQFSKLSAFYRYVKVVSERKELVFGGKGDLLLQEQMNQPQIKEIIEQYIETFQIVNFSTDFPIFSSKYKIIKNILIQPNLQAKYAIVQKGQAKIICVFDYKQMVADRLAYDIAEQTVDNGVAVVQEQSDLTILGAWRKKIFNCYYQSRYFYCRTEMQLALKFSKIIKELSQS